MDSLGNILMISEGNRHVNNTFRLADGILSIQLDKPTYERAGLQGKPIPSLGRKHIDARYGNLPLPLLRTSFCM